MHNDTVVGMEEPGYPDARNIFASRTRQLIELPVDQLGLDPQIVPANCEYVFTTPSHQCPTNVSMPLERRQDLIGRAETDDFILIEDDYDSQLLDAESPIPALKSIDDSGRVIYIGSLSKTIAPGLRLGYIVADSVLLEELRGLRRLMLRHPPANNQRAVALFLSLGHHDSLIRRLTQAIAGRRQALAENLRATLPEFHVPAADSGSAIWMKAPDEIDTSVLAEHARKRGVLIEPGQIFFNAADKPKCHLRAGISSIPLQKIAPGVSELAAAVTDYRNAALAP